MRQFAILLMVIAFGQLNAQINKDSYLYAELIESLEKQSDTIFIEDRNTLREFQFVECNDNYIKFSDKLSSGETLEIELKRKPFISTEHELDLTEAVYKELRGKKVVDYMTVKNLIDNQYSYGIDGNVPNFKIENLTVKINGQQIEIPESVYSNLFEPHFCKSYLPMKAYESSNGKYIYLYMDGSDGAGGYSVKWIFDKNKYISRIVATVEFMNGYDFIDLKEE